MNSYGDFPIKTLPVNKTLLTAQVHRRSAERLRDMCSANGGCFIKVGQHIGALDYLVPLEYAQTMRVFHDNAPQSSVHDMHRVLKHDLGKDVSIFEHS